MRNLSKAGDENYFHQLLLKYGPVVKVTVMGESNYICVRCNWDKHAVVQEQKCMGTSNLLHLTIVQANEYALFLV